MTHLHTSLALLLAATPIGLIAWWSDRNFGFMGAFKHYWPLGHRDCDFQGNTFPHTNNRSNLRHYLRPASHNLRPLNLDLSFLTGTETDLAEAVPNASLLKLTKKCCPGLVDRRLAAGRRDVWLAESAIDVYIATDAKSQGPSSQCCFCSHPFSSQRRPWS